MSMTFKIANSCQGLHFSKQNWLKLTGINNNQLMAMEIEGATTPPHYKQMLCCFLIRSVLCFGAWLAVQKGQKLPLKTQQQNFEILSAQQPSNQQLHCYLYDEKLPPEMDQEQEFGHCIRIHHFEVRKKEMKQIINTTINTEMELQSTNKRTNTIIKPWNGFKWKMNHEVVRNFFIK